MIRLNSRSASRRGFSLSELSVAMVAGSTLLMLSVTMVHQSFRWSSLSRDRVANDQIFQGLQQQFREDAHRALTLEVNVDADAETSEVMFAAADGTVVKYTAKGAVVRRVSDSVSAQNDYRFSESLRLSFGIEKNPKRAVLTVHMLTPVAGQERKIWRHVAPLVGRNRLLETAVPSNATEAQE